MCDPVSAAVVGTGMLASGWSTYNQSKAANRNMQAVQSAKENAYRSGIARQDGYAGEARSAFDTRNNAQGAEGFKSNLSDATDKRMQAFNSAKTASPDYVALDSTPKNVAMAREQAFGTADARTNRDNAGKAVLSGYGDTQFNQGLAGSAFGRAFGNIGDKAGRDSNLVGMDMQQAANNAYKAPNRTLGLVKTLGGMAAMYGAAGMPGAGQGAGAMPGMQYNQYGGAAPSTDFVGPMQPKLQTTPAFGSFGF